MPGMICVKGTAVNEVSRVLTRERFFEQAAFRLPA